MCAMLASAYAERQDGVVNVSERGEVGARRRGDDARSDDMAAADRPDEGAVPTSRGCVAMISSCLLMSLILGIGSYQTSSIWYDSSHTHAAFEQCGRIPGVWRTFEALYSPL